MILRNFACMMRNYNSRKLMMNDGAWSSNRSGISCSYLRNANNSSNYKTYNTYNNNFVIIGKGTTAPTFNDYVLADNSLMMGSDIVQVANHTNAYTNDNKMISITTSYQNVSSSPITVTEVGWDVKAYNTSGSTPADILLANALLTRTVLTTPVVMAPGEIYAFTVTITV